MARVPRRVEDDDTISADEVNAETSGARRQQEQVHVVVGVGVEVRDELLAF